LGFFGASTVNLTNVAIQMTGALSTGNGNTPDSTELEKT